MSAFGLCRRRSYQYTSHSNSVYVTTPKSLIYYIYCTYKGVCVGGGWGRGKRKKHFLYFHINGKIDDCIVKIPKSTRLT